MRTTSILTVAAIALVATVGSASAAEQFNSLAGIEVEVMSSQAMGEIRGGDADAFLIVDLTSSGGGFGIFDQQLSQFNTISDIGLIAAAEQLGIQRIPGFSPPMIEWREK